MEDNTTSTINVGLGKPKKPLPKNFWKFLFVGGVLFTFVLGYLIGGSSNREELEDQKRGLEEQLNTIASLKEQIQKLQEANGSETLQYTEGYDEDATNHDEYDSYGNDYSNEDNHYADHDINLYDDEEDEELVYITNTGEHYHRATCSSLSHSSYEVTLPEAIDAGYTPCKNCHPPTE